MEGVGKDISATAVWSKEKMADKPEDE